MLQRKATIDPRPRPRSHVEKCVPVALNSTGDSARAARVTSMSNNEPFIEVSAEKGPVQGLDRAAIESLIAKQYTGLRLLILRRTGDAEVAADLLNEAACTAWEKWQAGLIQRPEEIGGYIFQVAMNLLRNHRRSMAERPDRRAAPEVLGSLPDATEATDRWLDKQGRAAGQAHPPGAAHAARPRDPDTLLSPGPGQGCDLPRPVTRYRSVRQGPASREGSAEGAVRVARFAQVGSLYVLHRVTRRHDRGQHASYGSPSG